jgi:2-hydroxycyclohexanecarboxyl-CoA dehydrogenase
MDYNNKTVLVTGGASGIGKAVTLAFAMGGARVIVADIDAAKAKSLVEDTKRDGLAVEAAMLDLASRSSVLECAAGVLARHACVDILVNAAGFGPMQNFVDQSPDDTDRVVAGNLTGVLHLTKALLPAMIARNKGKIVNVASDAGRVGSTGETAYAAAKGGLIAFTKSLAREVARFSVNVNCVCPGPTDTPLLASRPDKFKDALTKAIPFRRFAKPSEIADAILFFSGPQSDYITGQTLSVSGGLTFAG